MLLVQPYYVPVRPDDVQAPALAAATRAVALDDSMASGHVALGFAKMRATEWADGERELRRALALDRQVEDGHFRLADLLLETGRIRDALDVLEEGTRLDPLYSIQLAYKGWALALLGRAEEARATMRQALALDPENITSNSLDQWVLDLVGSPDEVAAQARVNLSLSHLPMRRGVAAWSLTRGGARGEAAAILQSLEALPADTQGRATGLIFARLGLKDWSGALRALEDAVTREPQLVLSVNMVNHAFDPIRSDPRFAAVIRKLNLDVARFTLPDGGRSEQAAQ